MESVSKEVEQAKRDTGKQEKLKDLKRKHQRATIRGEQVAKRCKRELDYLKTSMVSAGMDAGEVEDVDDEDFE